MFEGLSTQEIIIVICALGIGFGLMRVMLTTKKEDSTSDSSRKYPYEFSEEEKSDQWFDILGVSPSASLEEIRSSYKNKISQYHPDKVSSLGAEFMTIAEKKTRQIKAAYEEAIKKFE